MPIAPNYFFNNTTREVFVQFLNIFNTFKVAKPDNREIQVPLVIVPMSKIAYNIRHSFPQQRQLTLPLISSFIDNIEIDPERMTPRVIEYVRLDDKSFVETFPSIPTKISIDLGIWTRYIDEKYQLFEQIAPLFGYHRVVYTKHPLFPDAEVKHWIKLSDVSEDNKDEQSAEENRILKTNLKFEIESMYFRPKTAQTLGPILEIDTYFREYVKKNVIEQHIIFGDEVTGEITHQW